MRKLRFLRYYYARLTLVSLVSVFFHLRPQLKGDLPKLLALMEVQEPGAVKTAQEINSSDPPVLLADICQDTLEIPQGRGRPMTIGSQCCTT